MKRKQSSEVFAEEHCYPAKMLKMGGISNQEMTIGLNTGDDGRNFGFKLSDKTAKKNLLSGAKRIPFEKDYKQKCVKLKFSSGAYKEAVLPTLVFWMSKLNKTFEYNSLSIRVSEVKAGYEENFKHFDTKVVLSTSNSRVVIHSYNSTQNIKVEESGYLNFPISYLEPIFLEAIVGSK